MHSLKLRQGALIRHHHLRDFVDSRRCGQLARIDEIEQLVGGAAAPQKERHSGQQLVVVEAHEVLVAVDGLPLLDSIEELAIEQQGLEHHRGCRCEVVLGFGFGDE